MRMSEIIKKIKNDKPCPAFQIHELRKELREKRKINTRYIPSDFILDGIKKDFKSYQLRTEGDYLIYNPSATGEKLKVNINLYVDFMEGDTEEQLKERLFKILREAEEANPSFRPGIRWTAVVVKRI